MKLYVTNTRELKPRFSELEKCLTSERLAAIRRVRIESAKLQYLAGGVLLDRVFGRAAVEQQQKNRWGKPWIPGERPFNLSNSGDWVVLALGDAGETSVGCDVERWKPHHYDGIAQRFHPQEQGYCFQATGDERIRRFYQLWTLNESYMKFVGKGFALAPRTFCIALPESQGQGTKTTGAPRLVSTPEADFAQCQFQLWEDLPGYTLAACWDGDAPCVREFLEI